MKERIPSVSMILVMTIRKKIQSNCQKKCCDEKHVDLILISKREKNHCVLFKAFNTFRYDYTLHCRRKHFCSCFLQAYRAADVLKCHIKDCFQINCKQTIKMLPKGEHVKFKNYERGKSKWFL